jgi:hypothetical protein
MIVKREDYVAGFRRMNIPLWPPRMTRPSSRRAHPVAGGGSCRRSTEPAALAALEAQAFGRSRSALWTPSHLSSVFRHCQYRGRRRLIGCAVLELKDLVEPVKRGDRTQPRFWGPIHQHADQNLGGCWSTGNFVDTKETVLVSNFSRAILQDRPGEACQELS